MSTKLAKTVFSGLKLKKGFVTDEQREEAL